MASNQEAEFQLKCQLIHKVSQRPVLFNKGHPQHFIRGAKQEEFSNIGVVLGIPGKYHVEIHHNNLHLDL